MSVLLNRSVARDWVDLGGGVHVHMRPATALDEELAQARAKTVIRQLIEAGDTLQTYGLDEVVPGDVFAKGVSEESLGAGIVFYAAELATRLVSAWRGVELEPGVEAQLTLANLGRLMAERPAPGSASFAHTFIVKASARVALGRDEGNGSAAAPNGTGTAAQTIAADATKTTTPAPSD